MISQTEAAIRLRVSVRSLQRYAKQGIFPKPTIIDGRAFYKQGDLERFIQRAC